MVTFFLFGNEDHYEHERPEGQVQEGGLDMEEAANLVDDSAVNEREEAPHVQMTIEVVEDIQEPFNVL